MQEGNTEAIVAKLKEKLQTVAMFQFIKTDGTVRTAYGTLNPKLLPKKYTDEQVAHLVEKARDLDMAIRTDTAILSEVEDLSKAYEPFLPKPAKESEPKEGIITYFDLEAVAWRSCKSDSITVVF